MSPVPPTDEDRQLAELLARFDQERKHGGSSSTSDPPLGQEALRRFRRAQDCLRLLDRARPAAELLRGLPDYEVIEELGRGGMGVVFKARQLSLNRLVAVKVLRDGLLANPEQRQRFRREAEAVARLNHPNLVHIHEVGDHEGRPFLVLEYVPGRSLEQVLTGQPMPPAEAAALVETLARAIQAAHDSGIVHRDLKPANILLIADCGLRIADCPEESAIRNPQSAIPKIVDFGLAREVASAAVLTQSDQIVGTAGYMAPEQAGPRSGVVGPPADIWALGVLLYECLTGRVPFKGVNSWDTLQQVLHEEPIAPSRLVRQVPRDLQTICLKCLEKDPARRYASAAALAEDLRRFQAGEPIQARPVGPVGRTWRWGRRNPRVAGLLGLLFLVVVSAFVGITSLWRLAVNRHEEAQSEGRRAEANFRKVLEAADALLIEVAQTDLLQEPHMAPARRRILERVLRYYRGFLEEQSDHPAVRGEIGRARMQLGRIEHLLGRSDRAEEHFGQAIALFEQLPTGRKHLAAAHLELGVVYLDTGRHPAAEAAFHQAIALGRDAAPNLEVLDVVAQCYNRLGTLYQTTSAPAKSEEAYQQALTLRQQLVDAQPQAAHYRHSLIMIHGNLAIIQHAAGRLDQAETSFRNAQRDAQRLAADHPHDAACRHTLATVHNNVGLHYQQRRLSAPALEAFQLALPILEELSRDHGDILEYQNAFARAHNNVGLLYLDLGRKDDARRAFLKALEVRQRLTREYPRRAEFAVGLGVVSRNLGHVCRDDSQFDDALGWYGKAIDTLAAVLQEEAKHEAAKRFLSETHFNRARPLGRLGRYEPAITDWDRALALDSGAGRVRLQLGRADALARHGDHRQASTAAAALAQVPGVSAAILYDVAAIYALSAGAVRQDANLAERYRQAALALLLRLRDAGFFKEPARRTQLQQERDFEALRAQPAFQELLRPPGR